MVIIVQLKNRTVRAMQHLTFYRHALKRIHGKVPVEIIKVKRVCLIELMEALPDEPQRFAAVLLARRRHMRHFNL